MGGALRDALLGRTSTDMDLACEGSARKLAEDLAQSLRGTVVVLDNATRVYRVVLPATASSVPSSDAREQVGWAAGPRLAQRSAASSGAKRQLGMGQDSRLSNGPNRGSGGLKESKDAPSIRQVDVAQIQGRSIDEDLRRRDFTCNAMAVSAADPGALLDPRGGRADLERRLLRADDPKVFADDPIRLLRAFRIAAQLGLEIEAKTLGRIRAHRSRVLAPAGERVRFELMALLSCAESHRWLRLMDRADLLTSLFPDLEASRRCAAVYYGKGGVLRHTLDALERMDFLLASPEAAFPGLARELRAHYESAGGTTAHAAVLRLAVLLHDVAKPATARRIGGRLRFFGHEELGAKMATATLRRLRCSREEIDTIALCVRHHLRPGNLAANAVVSDKAVFRFFRELGPRGVDLLLVCWADHASYLAVDKLRPVLKFVAADPHTFRPASVRNADTRKTLRHLQVLRYLLGNYFFRKDRVVAPPRLLDGNVVMKTLGLPPGPKVGKILAKLQEAQAEGKVMDRQAALRFIQKVRV